MLLMTTWNELRSFFFKSVKSSTKVQTHLIFLFQLGWIWGRLHGKQTGLRCLNTCWNCALSLPLSAIFTQFPAHTGTNVAHAAWVHQPPPRVGSLSALLVTSQSALVSLAHLIRPHLCLSSGTSPIKTAAPNDWDQTLTKSPSSGHERQEVWATVIWSSAVMEENISFKMEGTAKSISYPILSFSSASSFSQEHRRWKGRFSQCFVRLSGQ